MATWIETSIFIAEKTSRLYILHCKTRTPTLLRPYRFFRFRRTIVIFLWTHGHRAYFPAYQQSDGYLSIPKRGSFMISLQNAEQKNRDGKSHLATMSHILRTYLCIKPKQTSTRMEHEKHNSCTTIRTAKSRFLRTCVQSGQAADNMQATRRRSCCTLRLFVPIG